MTVHRTEKELGLAAYILDGESPHIAKLEHTSISAFNWNIREHESNLR
jgi:hypothetical protein